MSEPQENIYFPPPGHSVYNHDRRTPEEVGLSPALIGQIKQYVNNLPYTQGAIEPRWALWRHVITQSAGFDYPHGDHPAYRPGENFHYGQVLSGGHRELSKDDSLNAIDPSGLGKVDNEADFVAGSRKVGEHLRQMNITESLNRLQLDDDFFIDQKLDISEMFSAFLRGFSPRRQPRHIPLYDSKPEINIRRHI